MKLRTASKPNNPFIVVEFRSWNNLVESWYIREKSLNPPESCVFSQYWTETRKSYYGRHQKVR